MSLQTPRRQSHILLYNALLSVFLQKVRQSQANSLLFHQTSPKRTLSTKQRAGNTRLPTDSGVTEIKGRVRLVLKLHHRVNVIYPVVTLLPAGEIIMSETTSAKNLSLLNKVSQVGTIPHEYPRF